MEEKKIILLSCGSFDRGFLKKVSGAVEDEYRCKVLTEECHPDLSPYYNPARRQYDGDRLLNRIPEWTSSGYSKLIGLFSVDLYIPVLSHIFGQAFLGWQTAIASSFRLRNELYGLKQDDGLLQSRTIKEVIHELGHTFGLVHCHTLSCVMRSSTYVEEIDLKGMALCSTCRSLIESDSILP